MRRSYNREYYHNLGKQFAPLLDANYSYDEIGAELGVSHQTAWHECMIALGKLVHGLRKQLRPSRIKWVHN